MSRWAQKRSERRSWSKEIGVREAELRSAEDRKHTLTAPQARRTETTLEALRLRAAELRDKVDARRSWLDEHPDALGRLFYVDHQIAHRRAELEEYLRKKSGELTPQEQVVRQSQRARSRRRDDPYRAPYPPAAIQPNRDLGHGFGR